jgi:hypothetical protein
MPWDEKRFQERIKRRAADLGLTVREVMRKAGCSEDTFTKPPGPQGRTYNLIESIAGAVNWSVTEAIAGDAFSQLRYAISEAHYVLDEAIKRAGGEGRNIYFSLEALLVAEFLREPPFKYVEPHELDAFMGDRPSENMRQARRIIEKEQREHFDLLDKGRADLIERVANFLLLTSGQEEKVKEAQRRLDEERVRVKEEWAELSRKLEELDRLEAGFKAIRISAAA